MTPRRLVVYRTNATRNAWRWRVVGGNGRVIGASSEGFATRANALRNARLLSAVIYWKTQGASHERA